VKSFDAAEAAAYETRIHRVVPGYEALQQAVCHVAVELEPSRIFCSGAGTGAEVGSISTKLPHAEIEAGEPSLDMRALGEVRTAGSSNVTWVDEPTGSFNLVTSILVGHFVADEILFGYFAELGKLTAARGSLIVAVMAAPTSSAEAEDWIHHLATQLNKPADYDGRHERAQETYESLPENLRLRDAAVYEEVIARAGFRQEHVFFRRPMIHGWVYRKS
jgi:hypothetical protein